MRAPTLGRLALLALLLLVAGGCGVTDPDGPLVMQRWVTVWVVAPDGGTVCQERRCDYWPASGAWDCWNKPVRPCPPPAAGT